MNGDGLPEVVHKARFALNDFFVYENVGGLFPNQRLRFTGPEQSFGFWTDDFDGDGRLDLLTTSQYGAFVRNRMMIWRGVGWGLEFAAPRSYYTMSPGVTAADMDGDGDLDVIGEHLFRGWRINPSGTGRIRETTEAPTPVER